MTAEQLKRLEEFKSKHKPRVPIYAHMDEVHHLRTNGFSFEQIIIYFQDHWEIKTSLRTLKRVFQSAQGQSSKQQVVSMEQETNTEKKSAKDFFKNN